MATPSSRRLLQVTDHVAPAPTQAAASKEVDPKLYNDAVNFAGDVFGTKDKKRDPLRMLQFFDHFKDITADLPYNVADHLPGPLQSGQLSKKDIVTEAQTFVVRGENHVFQTILQNRFKSGLPASLTNIVVPIVSTVASATLPSGSTLVENPEHTQNLPVITQQILVSHPDDCERLARSHVKKQPNFTPILMDSVISTTDTEHWRKQRSHLVEAFLPNSSLAEIFPVSVARAKDCTGKLLDMGRGGRCVDMNDFFLHEAQAQLQMALFGSDTEFVERTNRPLRDVFKGDGEPGYLAAYMAELLENIEKERDQHSSPGSAGNVRGIDGPLSKVLAESDEGQLTKWGNGLIFAFAGHDTTGHTMTWLTLEMAKNPKMQQRLQAEVDALFDDIGDRPLEYADIHRLPFMTRCIVETLRLWPAVPNGTFRELQFDDTVKGGNGEDVFVPKGTYVQITTWPRHRSKELWGEDAETFNPDREFTNDEIYYGQPFAGFNPHSKRLSPFTYPPRDCLGKNFAQMEMRAILSYLFRNFTFELAEPMKSGDYDASAYNGLNAGTMGPADLTQPFKDRNGIKVAARGLPLHVSPRHDKLKLS